MEFRMIELTYDNVRNGLRKNISMTGICRSSDDANYVFKRALDIWNIPFSPTTEKTRCLIHFEEITLQFISIKTHFSDNWKSFKGVFMLHPSIKPYDLSQLKQQILVDMDQHNERYLETWRA